jgi:hypothetical protein
MAYMGKYQDFVGILLRLNHVEVSKIYMNVINFHTSTQFNPVRCQQNLFI